MAADCARTAQAATTYVDTGDGTPALNPPSAMIVASEDKALAFRLDAETDPSCPPPPYTLDNDFHGLESGSISESPLAPPARPTNTVFQRRVHEAIRGQFVLDPSLSMPAAVLPALEPGEERKNLYLETTHGAIRADVWFVRPSSSHNTRTTIAARSQYGSVTVKIRTEQQGNPFVLSASTTYGAITIHVPRSFQGFISLTTKYGCVRFSSPVKANTRVVSDVDHRMQGFIGDVIGTSSVDTVESWQGSEISAESEYGVIKIQYNDEPSAISQFCSKLFG